MLWSRLQTSCSLRPFVLRQCGNLNINHARAGTGSPTEVNPRRYACGSVRLAALNRLDNGDVFWHSISCVLLANVLALSCERT